MARYRIAKTILEAFLKHVSSCTENPDVLNESGCPFKADPGGLGWDALCFVLLIFQKRLFSSHYFVRIVDEAKAMAVLAARLVELMYFFFERSDISEYETVEKLCYRGAELIEELSKKQIQKQQELEKAVLQKIKNKMDSIKAAQKKIQGIKSKEPSTHQAGKGRLYTCRILFSEIFTDLLAHYMILQ